MRAPISVIIPTLNAEKTLPHCLAALMEGLEAGVIRELILTDGGSTDDTQKIADNVGSTWVSGPPSRGGQLGRGVQAASGPWLLIVHADTQLAEGWSTAAIAAMTSPGGYWGCLQFDSSGFSAKSVAGWANLRSRLGLPYGDQALLIDKDTYDSAGGYPDIPLMEDVALARQLKGRLKPLGAKAVTSAEKYKRAGWGRRGLRNLSILMRYFAGVSPDRLAKAYKR